MEDCFEEIHSLLKEHLYKDVIELLYDSKTGRIKGIYRCDLNHAWYVVGDIFYKQKLYENAIAPFKKSIKYRQDDIEALWALANCYIEICRPEKAEHFLRMALKYDNGREELAYNLGNALFDQEKYQEAICEYRKVSPTHSTLYELAGKNIRISLSKMR